MKEGEFGELVEVDVRDLDDAKSVEGVGEVCEGDGAVDDVEVVAGELAGVEGESGGGESGGLEEAATGEVFLGRESCKEWIWGGGGRRGVMRIWRRSVLRENGHRSFYRVSEAQGLDSGGASR